MKIKKSYIYALINPLNDQLFYIGKSINPKKRLSNHFCRSNLNKNGLVNTLLRKLKKKNIKPIVKILCVCYIKNENIMEKRYISIYKNNGYKLLNQRSGGDGWQNISNKQFNYNPYIAAKAAMKKIILRNIKTGEEKEFPAVLKAAKFLKTYPSTVSSVLTKKEQSVKGYFCRYINEPFIYPEYPNSPKIKRICPKTGKIKIYNRPCDTKYDGFDPNGVTEVCHKRPPTRKHHKGYRWEFLNAK